MLAGSQCLHAPCLDLRPHREPERDRRRFWPSDRPRKDRPERDRRPFWPSDRSQNSNTVVKKWSDRSPPLPTLMLQASEPIVRPNLGALIVGIVGTWSLWRPAKSSPLPEVPEDPRIDVPTSPFPTSKVDGVRPDAISSSEGYMRADVQRALERQLGRVSAKAPWTAGSIDLRGTAMYHSYV
jgi:hypothetical protein